LSIIDSIRQLAQAGDISYTSHAINQMLARGISTDTVERILGAQDNQIVETQSPSVTPGMQHRDSRYLIYSPSQEDVIVVSLLLSQPTPEVRVVTTERVEDDKWNRVEGGNPAIVRK